MCMKQYAHRATGEGYITVDNLEPNPKNPIIAAFFRNIGYADQLGSGQEPEFVEGDIFRIIVPLDDEYSFDFGTIPGKKVPIIYQRVPIKCR